MKKITMIVCFTICLTIILGMNSVLAIDINDNTKNYTESINQEEIDEIFTDLNNLALEKKKMELFNKQIISNNSFNSIQANISEQNKLEKRLEKLGVHKLNPNNINDVNSLLEIINMSGSSNNQTRSLFDFTILMNVYSIYQYTGTYTINGVSYDYKYVRVVDNKGYVDSKLTKAQLITLVGYEYTTVSNLLSYNFSYGFSSFLGMIPYGWVADWILGNIFTVLNSYNGSSPVVYNSNNGIYGINIISITDMTYYYIRVNGTWYDCGSRASNIGLARADSFTANISGTPVAWSYTYPNATSSTGYAWYWYLENFVNTAWPVNHSIGNIQIYGTNGASATFTPCFVSNPLGLI